MKVLIMPIVLAVFVFFACKPTVDMENKNKDLAEPVSSKDTSASDATQMERLQFKIRIDAPPDVVYNKMIDAEDFKKWTSIFSPTSYFEGTWEKDSKMHFLALDEEGNPSGMLSRIKENIPNKFISIEHLGIVMNGEEITEGEDVEPLMGALENYTFTEVDGQTELQVDTDTFSGLKDFFLDTWPKALEELKKMCAVD